MVFQVPPGQGTIKLVLAFTSQLMWLGPQVCAKYAKSAKVTEQPRLLFLTTYLVEYGFCAVSVILTPKSGTLDICKRRNLYAKLTCFSSRFSC